MGWVVHVPYISLRQIVLLIDLAKTRWSIHVSKSFRGDEMVHI